jgi:hypothetical protein
MGGRGIILNFFLYAGLAFAAIGAYLMFQGDVGGTIGSTFLLMGAIWVVVALGVRRFYGRMQANEQAERALLASGVKAIGIVESVETTGMVLNNVNHQINLRLRVQSPDGVDFIHERKMFVPFHGMPQPGDQLDVAFDPRDHSKVALASDPNSNTAGGRLLLLRRPTATVESSSDSLIDQLERLEDLRRNGTLTQAEFDAQKARVLAGASAT